MVAVVAHHKVAALRHGAGEAAAVFFVAAVLVLNVGLRFLSLRIGDEDVVAEGIGADGRHAVGFEHVEVPSGKIGGKAAGFDGLLRVVVVRVGVGARFGVSFDDAAVDFEHFVFVFDGIARQADGAFDVVDGGFERIVEHHHVAALHFARINQNVVDNRRADAVGEFVDEDKVAFYQPRAHGAGRDLERLGHEGAQHENGEDDGEKARHIVAEVVFVVERAGEDFLAFVVGLHLPRRLERELAPQPHGAGKGDKNQQNGGEAEFDCQHAEHADHHQQVAPLQAVAPFAFFVALFAAEGKQADARDQGGNGEIDKLVHDFFPCCL